MVMMETVISGITDLYPQLLRRKKALFTFICCMIGFALGIPMSTKVPTYFIFVYIIKLRSHELEGPCKFVREIGSSSQARLQYCQYNVQCIYNINFKQI